MRLSVELPDLKPDPLLKQLSHQFAEMQKQLMKQKKATNTDSAHAQTLRALSRQQDALLRMMEKSMGGKSSMSGQEDALLTAIKSLKHVIARNRPRTFGSNF